MKTNSTQIGRILDAFFGCGTVLFLGVADLPPTCAAST